ncbi:protein-export chaperone SecB [Phocoenobacter skyensis]|uniref:Protein-export protein SecB n=1 Tax=Phocoenobacter skyensis TaxID=97481 RepID=A0A1H7ZCI1_9PAST|nr:protein-export chaperone SecB [Pasteurella skyensis]MDP8080194.1 protein-export chaperone SecB [Pasteurella skyensis]MDP8086184.1 protein-export chaperone SecB [Pasteurella skyensis]MDP8163167.1 protein-export chaperone SecB [Pasteurella skyensis]MDP8170138.1 protein-export chaperone SecB [Pasteurella skyensis]MDP8173358.1 protein-export chaperone SecB [Pasteurella skyensis]
MSEENQVATEEEQEGQFELQIQRIYIKDVSFEAPNLPVIFQQEWEPDLSFELDTETKELGESLYEVTLHLNIQTTMKESKDVAFICEVKQSGVFSIAGIDGIQLAHCLAVTCPNILYPYARELVSSLVNRGSFPALNLSPLNFDALFMNYLESQQEEDEEGEQTPLN